MLFFLGESHSFRFIFLTFCAVVSLFNVMLMLLFFSLKAIPHQKDTARRKVHILVFHDTDGSDKHDTFLNKSECERSRGQTPPCLRAA